MKSKSSETNVPLPERSDEDLFRGVQRRGDRRAFSELVHRYERELYSYLRRFLGDATAAEDAFQAAFLQVFLKSDQFEEGRKFRPWLYSIATNAAIDAQRRGKRHRMVSLDRRQESYGDDDDAGSLMDLLESGETNPLAHMETEEQRDWVRKSIDELPEMLRSVVMLIYFQGMKYHEAAETLGIPTGTAKSRMHAAIVKLNEAWQHAHQ